MHNPRIAQQERCRSDAGRALPYTSDWVPNSRLHPRLSRPEKDCLQWVANGKTSWEIGKIMEISESTVVFHLKNSMKKLETVNRPQAIAVTMRLGFID